MTAAFTVDTAVEALGDGRFGCHVSERWGVVRGPNGGYVAALVLRAMEAAVAEPARAPRSLTCHYLRPPAVGPAEVHVVIERAGRNVSSLSARLVQEGRDCVLALGAFSLPVPQPLELRRGRPADVPSPGGIDPWPSPDEGPEIAKRLTLRPALGAPPFSGAAEAVTGGWMRLREPAPLDGPLVACLADAWLPASFVMGRRPFGVPTVDLTVHFRAPLPKPDQEVLGLFRSRHADSGLVEEDGELWGEDGELLAISRQLAIFR